MVKVIIDANILISAAITPGSIPAEVINLVKQDKINGVDLKKNLCYNLR